MGIWDTPNRKKIKGEGIVSNARELKSRDRIDTLIYMGGKLGGNLRIFRDCVIVSSEVVIENGYYRGEVLFRYKSQVPVIETERTLINIMRGPKLEYLLNLEDDV